VLRTEESDAENDSDSVTLIAKAASYHQSSNSE
jgi:hypothetical protein